MSESFLKVSDTVAIDERDLEERFVRSSGPGGQNVNKVATAVELRFDPEKCPDLSHAQKARLARLAGHRMTDEGIVVIKADRFRTQDMNRSDARARLVELIKAALVAPKPRIKTKPSRSSRQKRTDSKVKRGEVKKLRRARVDFD
jgi:ribosome-associated protein